MRAKLIFSTERMQNGYICIRGIIGERLYLYYSKREAERKREAEARAAAEQTAAKLKNKVVILKAKCGEKGRLYGSVTSQEVADAIQAGYEVEIDKRKVEIKEPVRQLGDYEVIVHLYPNVSTRMLLRVKNIAEG